MHHIWIVTVPEGKNGVVSVWNLLQLSISLLQHSNLLLQLLHEFFCLTHFSPLLISDQFWHLRASSLNGADHFSKDPLIVFHCCLCRALFGHKTRQETWIATYVSCYFLWLIQLTWRVFTACLRSCSSVSLSWMIRLDFLWVSPNDFCEQMELLELGI